MLSAGNRIRTSDLLITNELLYRLSYAGGFQSLTIIIRLCAICKYNY